MHFFLAPFLASTFTQKHHEKEFSPFTGYISGDYDCSSNTLPFRN